MALAGPHAWGEARIVSLLLEGRHFEAVEELLAWVGPEVRSFLLSTLRDPAVADEAYARFQASAQVELHRWSRTGSLRLWALRVARDAAHRTPPHRTLPHQTAPSRAASRPSAEAVPARLPGDAVLDDLTRLRELLSKDDVLLLWLRVGQGLSWPEVAAELAGRGMPLDVASLRARFETLKRLLAREAHALGLTGDEDD